MTSFTDHDDLKHLDEKDPLRQIKQRFLIPDGVYYMNGNSLGPLSTDAKTRMDKAVSEEWGHELIKGWNTAGWYDMPKRVGDKIGTLIGAKPGETLLCDSTSVNLFKAVNAALSIQKGRKKIISESGNFPTDLYILDGTHRFSKGEYELAILDRSEILNAIDEETAVVVLTHVHYVSGEIFPMKEINLRAHEKGALVVWDLSHSVGAIKTDLEGSCADFAVGCGYKHLNGGPGAPAFIYAAKRHHAQIRQPLSGWFGHEAPFSFIDDYIPANDARKLLCGTTGVLGASALEAAVDLFLEVREEERLEKLYRMSRLFDAMIAEKCSPYGFERVSPPDPENRGAHLSYRHPDGYAIMQNLIAKGVIGDFRAPDYLRFGISPLFMGYEDLLKVTDILEEILKSKSYEAAQYQVKHAVT